MTWEALTAVATAFTGVVIVATVVVGARQLRLTRDTLDQLRRATQLEGTTRVMDDFMGPEFREARMFVTHELPAKMKDEAFRATISHMGSGDALVHKELTVLRTLERVGSYIKYGLLDGDIIYDVFSPVVMSMWERLQPVIEIHRREGGEGYWENFEYFYRAARRWHASQNSKAEYLKRSNFK